ncbi:hypothetical protein T492DRAFT_864520 [Pavlovales sp. CCMP2436]|nr:hypothetical protein T492DRAFT_864520 [Pavlovales sp. CCMP2436]
MTTLAKLMKRHVEGCVQHRGVQSRAQSAGDPFRSFQAADDIEDADLHDEDIGPQKRPDQMQSASKAAISKVKHMGGRIAAGAGCVAATTGRAAVGARDRLIAVDRAAVGRMREHTARIARNGVRSVAERSVDWALNRTAGSVRDSLIDEGAPKIVRYAVALVFEAVWPELALEIKANVMLSINESLEPYVLPWTLSL